jgi:hypothetical protein
MGDSNPSIDDYFKENIPIKDFIGTFNQGINVYNNNLKEMKEKEKNLKKGGLDIKNRINKIQKKNTYSRGADLLSRKIDFYNYWIKVLYTTHKITLVVLCVIIIVMLIYKLLNK